jgi:hypothetical protein
VVVAGNTFSSAEQPSPTGSRATANAPCVNYMSKPHQRTLWPHMGAL